MARARPGNRRPNAESYPRLDRAHSPSLRNWEKPPGPAAKTMTSDAVVDMGWGRLIFGHTFTDQKQIVDLLCEEGPQQRDIAFYLRDPHVILSMAPQQLFLDPSHTYRLWSSHYRQTGPPPQGLRVRRIETRQDAEEIRRIYAARHMVKPTVDFILDKNTQRLRTYLVAESVPDGSIVGAVTGVDHVKAFNDPENGASLWCLAVDPQCQVPGAGNGLVRHLVEHYFARSRQYVDLSVMHDNTEAIGLYESLGFRRVPVFCVKRKNPINEPLFIAPAPDEALNPYAQIIIAEARRRGIHANVLDAEGGYFRLTMGGRSIVCRESLSELTTAIAMSRCDDKQATRRVLIDAGLNVPDQQAAGDGEANRAFLQRHGQIVVKPRRGEQGAGITVGVRTDEELDEAVAYAQQVCDQVVLEQFCEGEDLRVIVIDFRVVAAAVRRPPVITGTGKHTVEQLIEKYNRRRAAATGGESQIPIDSHTRRCVADAGYQLSDIPEYDTTIRLRKAANLHTGGTIHDVTDALHPALAEAAVEAARAIDIPVTGLDFLTPHVDGSAYVIIEANERPGLANHEPAPTAERFIDLLFPHSRAV